MRGFTFIKVFYLFVMASKKSCTYCAIACRFFKLRHYRLRFVLLPQALIGDSYGPEQMVTELSKGEFQLLCDAARSTDLALIKKFYKLDNNAIPPTFVYQVINIIFYQVISAICHTLVCPEGKFLTPLCIRY